jgi:hypothetical protein
LIGFFPSEGRIKVGLLFFDLTLTLFFEERE